MLYEKYENRMKRIAKFKVAVYKFRVIILVSLGLILAGIGALIGCKGIITEDVILSSPSVVYGSDYSVSAKAFISDVEFEFCGADGVWKTQKPYLAGDYKVRAKANRAFGGKSYGKEKPFSILPKPVECSVANEITYGENPVSCAGLLFGDKLSVPKVIKLVVNDGGHDIDFTDADFMITSKSGLDVSFCYQLTYPSAVNVTVNKKQISVTSCSALKEYDGTPLVCEDYTAGQTVTGDIIEVTFGDMPVDVCTNVNNEISATFTDGTNDVSFCYDVNYVFGKLTVTRRNVTVAPEDKTKVYDGTPLKADMLTVKQGSLVLDHVFTDVEFIGEITDVESVQSGINQSLIKIIDGDSNIKTQNYNVTFESGTLTVEKRNIKAIKNASKIYDDEFFVVDQFEFETENYYPLVEGHTLKIGTNDVIFGEYTGSDLEISVISGGLVTANYEINIDDVMLKIDKRPVIIKVKDETKIYDTETLYPSEIEFPPPESGTFSLVYGHHIANLTLDGEIVNFGQAYSSVTAFDIQRAGGDTVTENYDLILREGTLTVEKCPVTVTVSGGKIYDDTDAVADYLELTVLRYDGGTSLYDGHTLEYVVLSGTPSTDVGTYTPNTEYVGVKGADQSDLSDNYDVEWINGDFTVTKRHVVLTTDSEEKEYDGQPLSCEQISVTEGTLAESHYILATGFPTVTAVSTVDNTPAAVSILKESVNKTDNYDIDLVSGTLTVNKRTLNIELYQVQKVYDGLSASVDERFWLRTPSQLLPSDSIIGLNNFVVKNGDLVVSQNNIVDAGIYTVTATANINYGGAYTGYYAVTVTGTITIDRASVKLISASASVPYSEGVILTADEYYIAQGAFIGGDVCTVIITGEQSEVGTSPNTIQKITVNGETLSIYGDGVYYFKNYSMTVVFGTLEIYLNEQT